MSEKEVVAMPTLKQIAVVLDCQVERVRSVAKKPIPGEAYDPSKINWSAVEAFIGNRLDKTGYDSVEAVLDAAKEVEVTTRAVGQATKMLEVEGSTTTPERKLDVKAGDVIVDKKKGIEYEVDYVNPTITVYHPISETGALTLSNAIGNRNFNSKFALKN